MSNSQYKRAAAIESAVKIQREFWMNKRSILDLCVSGQAFGPFQAKKEGHNKTVYELQGDTTQIVSLGEEGVNILSTKGEFVGQGKTTATGLTTEYILPDKFFLAKQHVFSKKVDYDSLPIWPDYSKIRHPAGIANIPSKYIDGLDNAAAAAIKGVAAGNYLFGVKGPPGTGKTTLIGRVTAYMAGELGMKICILANAHKAVDEALASIANSRTKFGLQFEIIKKTTRTAQFKSSPLSKTCSLWNTKEYELDQTKGYVVGGVLASTYPADKFDLVIIDEAGQIPVFVGAKVSPLAPKFAFFGDDSQLPPILEAQHEPKVKASCLSALMANDPTGTHVVELEVTHRLPSALANVVGKFFYPSTAFRSSEQNRDSHFQAPQNWPTKENLGFVSISNQESTNSNMEEVTTVEHLIKSLIGAQAAFDQKKQIISASDIAVLTPFKVQERLLTKSLKPLGVETVGTVDIMQGQSKAIVIFCITATNPQYMATCAQWLFEPNRINVGISRAKAGCYLVCNPDSISTALPTSALGVSRLETFKRIMSCFQNKNS